MITMKNWRQSMSEDLRLRDLSSRTAEAYLLATRLFLERIGKPPEALTEADIRGYILHLRDDKRQAPSSINIAICALRFFFNFTLQRDYEVFALLRVNRPRTLPVVLSRAEVLRLLGAVEHPVRRMALTTIYALGLRLGEGLHLQSSHIDSARQMVWVRSGKGAKDRRVPLPKPLLHKLRTYWKNDRPVSTLPLLFVSSEGKPIHETTLQKTFTAAQEELNLPRRATIHTLRHYVPFRTMSGSASRSADMIGILDQVEKSSSRLPDIAFPGLQTVEESQ
jgi:integrase/recombinase XerD